MVNRSLLGVAFLASCLLAVPAESAAQNKAPKKSKVGEYKGIRAGQAGITAPGAQNAKRRGNKVFWVGFEPREGGSSRFFFQAGSELEVQQWIEGKTLVVLLEKARIGNRTVGRRMDTRFFDTAIREMRVRKVGKRKAKGERPKHPAGLELRISFKNPADLSQAQVSGGQEADGYYYVYLDFGPGSERPDEEGAGLEDAADDIDVDAAEE